MKLLFSLIETDAINANLLCRPTSQLSIFLLMTDIILNFLRYPELNKPDKVEILLNSKSLAVPVICMLLNMLRTPAE
ncbi:hypothetical protein QE439_000415 [Pedobacter agri]|nr:hypothetical protein [Pedobacter agri]